MLEQVRKQLMDKLRREKKEKEVEQVQLSPESPQLTAPQQPPPLQTESLQTEPLRSKSKFSLSPVVDRFKKLKLKKPKLKRKSEEQKQEQKQKQKQKQKQEKKITPLVLSPDCQVGEGRKKWSLIFEHYRVKSSENKESFSVYDPTSKRWLVWKKREKVKERPLYPVLYEFAKKVEKEKKAGTLHLFVKADCGVCRVTVIPSMDKIHEKFRYEFSKKKEEIENSEVIAFVNSLSLSPYFLLTNDKELVKKIEERISTLPRPEPVLKELKEKVNNYIVVTDDMVSYILEQAGKSSELSLPQEFELKPKQVALAGLILSLLSALYFGYSYYQKKKEEELMRMQAQQQRKQWTPTLSFKKNHVFYRVFEGEEKKLAKLVYSLTPDFVEAGISGSEMRIVYEYNSPVVGAVRKQGKYRLVLKESVNVNHPDWKSLRSKPPINVSSAKAVYLSLPEKIKNSVVEVKKEEVDGVPFICFHIDYHEDLPSFEIAKRLLSFPATTKVEVIQVTKKETSYSLTFRGKVCGLEE